MLSTQMSMHMANKWTLLNISDNRTISLLSSESPSFFGYFTVGLDDIPVFP